MEHESQLKIVESGFTDLSAPERLSVLSSSDIPSEKLKQLCDQVEPGFVLNLEGIDKCPRVLLIGAYEPTELPAGRFNAPPFGLQRLASFLRAGGINANIFDVTTRGKQALLDHLEEEKYDLIGFSVLGPTLPNDIQLTHEVKSLNPHATLIGGGIVPTAEPNLLKQSALDYVIRGYGEDSLLDLIVKGGTEQVTDNIPGVWKRNDTGFIGKMAKPVTNRDLRIYSYLFDPEIGLDVNYYNPNGLYEGIDPSRVKTFRFIGQGFCPRECTFCATRNFQYLATGKGHLAYLTLGGKERLKIITNILNRLPDIQTIFINDDDFFTNTKVSIEFFNRVVESKNNG